MTLGWLFLRVTDAWVSKRSKSRMFDMVSSRTSCLIPRWSTGVSSTCATRCIVSKYDSSSSVMLTAASTVVGCRCFTAKATCGLSNCVRYCSKASVRAQGGECSIRQDPQVLAKIGPSLRLLLRRVEFRHIQNPLTLRFEASAWCLDGLQVSGLSFFRQP